MKPVPLLLVGVLLLSTLFTHAQVKIDYNNKTTIDAQGYFGKRYAKKLHRLAIPSKERFLLKEKQTQQSGDKQFHIAEPVSVNIDFISSAAWIEDGLYSYGKYTIHADSAQTLSVNFDKFFLPEGTELYIYNGDGTIIMGPIGPGENNDGRKWGSGIFRGEDLNLEVKIPTKSKMDLQLHISNIAYGFKQIFVDKTGGFGLSGSCNINVLCPLGATWTEERNSVTLIINETGSDLCSGAMIANTCSTNTPYVLTANHCYVASTGVAGWRFQFQAWSPTCTPSANSTGVIFNGSTLRANYAPSDFALLELSQTPGVTSSIRYAGWNKSATAATNTTGIHHPSGDVMKISTDISAPSKTGNNGGTGSDHWQVNWDNGVTEGGSSGSPLFDQNHRIVGQLHGGYSSCTSADKRDWYGAFVNSWTGGGTNATRLSNWLDPNNSGVTTLNTVNVSALHGSTGTTQFVSGPEVLCSGTVQLSYLTDNVLYTAGTVTWTSSNTSVATVTSTGNPATVTKVGDGLVTITGSIIGGCGPTTGPIPRPHLIGVGIPPVPTMTYTKTTTTDYIFTASPVGAPGGYDWFYDGVQIRWNADGVTYRTIPCYTTHYIYCRQTNACGSSAYGTPFRIDNLCTLTMLQYNVYPNPTESMVTIEVADQVGSGFQKSKLLHSTSFSIIRIYDNNGILRKEVKITAGSSKAQINVGDLPAGIYFVEILGSDRSERHKLVITGK